MTEWLLLISICATNGSTNTDDWSCLVQRTTQAIPMARNPSETFEAGWLSKRLCEDDNPETSFVYWSQDGVASFVNLEINKNHRLGGLVARSYCQEVPHA